MICVYLLFHVHFVLEEKCDPDVSRREFGLTGGVPNWATARDSSVNGRMMGVLYLGRGFGRY